MTYGCFILLSIPPAIGSRQLRGTRTAYPKEGDGPEVIPSRNALVLKTTDPQEFLGLFGELRVHPDQEGAIRRAGRVTARPYRWSEIVQRVLVPCVSCLAAAGPESKVA
jgi:hypothetical protein